MKTLYWQYILVMASVTYLIRVLPMTFIRKQLKNRIIRSFLYYVPYVTLAVMTFPAILGATASRWSALAALFIGVVLAFFGQDLMVVSLACCVTVYLAELFL
jgi:branched-subunit amino acid transport protein